MRKSALAEKMNRDEFWHNHLAVAAGLFGVLDGQAQTRTELKCTPGFVKYYVGKVSDPAKHSDTWGGARNLKFDELTQLRVERYIRRKLTRNPRLTPDEIAR